MKKYQLSIRHACEIFKISRTAYYYINKGKEDRRLVIEILALTQRNPTFGYWKIHYQLLDQGFVVNHKRVYRLYKELGLVLTRETN